MTEHAVSDGKIGRCMNDHTKKKDSRKATIPEFTYETGAVSSQQTKKTIANALDLQALQCPNSKHDGHGNLPSRKEKHQFLGIDPREGDTATMTQRTLPPEQLRLNLATHDVIEHMNAALTTEHPAHAITIPEDQFRRCVATYPFNLSWPEMWQRLRIEPRAEDEELLTALATKRRTT
jgi:hypothetical protein